MVLLKGKIKKIKDLRNYIILWFKEYVFIYLEGVNRKCEWFNQLCKEYRQNGRLICIKSVVCLRVYFIKYVIIKY